MEDHIFPDIFECPGFPITLAFTPERGCYFSERISGNLWFVKEGKLKLVKRFPIVPITGHHESGLLGIALDPDFGKNDLIYCYYTFGKSEDNYWNRVVRIDGSGRNEEILLDNIPAGRIHNGGILAFAPDKTLYIGVGVKNEVMGKSQDKEYLGGKVLRIKSDGTIPADNPFPGSPVYSYGHRNVFGLAFHPESGELFISDVGPDANDEVNIIEKGGNYGWPLAAGFTGDPRFINPVIAYTPTITPTQNLFIGNQLYFGSYNEGTVHRLTIDESGRRSVIKEEIVYRGKTFGVTGVFHGTDGQFYATTPDKIIRFAPKAVDPAGLILGKTKAA